MGRRWPHLSRTAVGLLVALTAWFALFSALLSLAGRPAVRRWLAQTIAEKASQAVGSPVVVDDVKLTLYPPRISLRGVRVGESERPVLTVRVAEITVSQIDIADRELVLSFLRLDGVHLDTALSPGQDDGGKPWMHVIVRQLEVRDVVVERLSLPDGIAFEAYGVEGRWTGTRRRPVSAAVAHVRRMRLLVPGLRPIEGAVSAWGRLKESGWEIGKFRGAGEGWSLSGRAAGGSAVTNGEGEVGLDLAALDTAVEAGAGLAGWLHGRWSAASGADDFRIVLDLSGDRVQAAGFVLSEVRGEVEVNPDGVEGSLHEGRFAGGVVEGSYRLEGLGAPWRHRVAARGSRLGLSEFLRQIGVDDGGLAARADLNAEVAWEGMRIGAGIGTGVADLEPDQGDLPVAGRLVARLDGQPALRFEAPALSVADGAVKWEGSLTLGEWVPNWSVRGDGLPVAAIRRALRGWVGSDVLPADLLGSATFDIRLRRPFDRLAVTGDAAVAPISLGAVDADGLVVSFSVADGSLTVDEATITVGGGRAFVRGGMSLDDALPLALEFEGNNVPLDRFADWAGISAPVSGWVGFRGSLGGPLEAPSGDIALELKGVTFAGAELGAGTGAIRVADGIVRLREVSVGPLAADIDVDVLGRQASVAARLDDFALEAISPPLARLLGGSVDCSVEGAFPFDAPSGRLLITTAGGGKGEVVLSDEALNLRVERPGAWQVSSELRRKRRSFSGRTHFRIDSLGAVGEQLGGTNVPIDGSLAGEADVVLAPGRAAHVAGAVTEARLDVEGGAASLVRPAAFTISGGAVSLSPLVLEGPGMSISCDLQRDAEGRLSGHVDGDLPAELLALLWREGQPRGRVRLDARISGTDSRPELVGQATVHNGSLMIPGVPGPVTRINGPIALVNSSLELDAVSFVAAGGEGTCSGKVSVVYGLELDLSLAVRSIRYPLAPGLSPIISASMRLVGPLESLVLSGTGLVETTYYRRNVSLERVVLDALFGTERATTPEQQAMALNLLFEVPGTLIVETPLARLTMSGELRITGTADRPGVIGQLEVMPGGEVELSGVQYAVEHAILTFSDPQGIAPYIDVLARGTVEFWEVTVGLSGTLSRLTPVLSSNPPLPEADILALISSGRGPQAGGVGEGGVVAGNLLAEQLTSAVAGRARTLLDLDQLRVDPAAVTQTGDPTARLTVVKQLSPGWTVTLSTNLASNREEVIVSRWRLAPGVFLEAMRDSDSSYSMEVKWKRRY